MKTKFIINYSGINVWNHGHHLRWRCWAFSKAPKCLEPLVSAISNFYRENLIFFPEILMATSKKLVVFLKLVLPSCGEISSFIQLYSRREVTRLCRFPGISFSPQFREYGGEMAAAGRKIGSSECGAAAPQGTNKLHSLRRGSVWKERMPKRGREQE